MNSRSLNDLHPLVRPLVNKFLANCNAEALDILVTCTYRSNEEQARLYAIGRTVPGKIVTRAKPGQSMHNFTVDGRPSSLAVDIVPLRHGKPVWDASDLIWSRVGAIGKRAGLEWAGEWKRFRESPHFQHPEAKYIRIGGVKP